MKVLAALFLALLLAVLGYSVFWLVSLQYTTAQMRGAIEGALHASVNYGQPQWVPDALYVTMDLPAIRIEMKDGPVKALSASSLRLSSNFFKRDRWTMLLPKRVEITLADNRKLLLETEDGEVLWAQEGNRLTLKATKVRLLDLAGNEVGKLGDVMLGRGSSDKGVTLDLASRPEWQGGNGVLSGKLILPEPVFGALVNLLGTGRMPAVGDIMHAMAGSLREGDMFSFDNVSFRRNEAGASTGGAIFGDVHVLEGGKLGGSLVIASETPGVLAGWVERSGMLAPRNVMEDTGSRRFIYNAGKMTSVRFHYIQDVLTLNSLPVGPLPVARDIVAKLWP